MNNLRQFVFLLAAVLQATGAAAATLQVGDEICTSGYVTCSHCLGRESIAIDGHPLQSLQNPDEHSFHCLFDEPECGNGGYEIVVPSFSDGIGGENCRAYKVNAEASRFFTVVGRIKGASGGTCSTCTGPNDGREAGFQVSFRGVVEGVGDANTPATVSVDFSTLAFEPSTCNGGPPDHCLFSVPSLPELSDETDTVSEPPFLYLDFFPDPTRTPTPYPTVSPTTDQPTYRPSERPTTQPTNQPSKRPTNTPTRSPTPLPTTTPTKAPTGSPTASPTVTPTVTPTVSPTVSPTISPTTSPTKNPTASPTTEAPSNYPTITPTRRPTEMPTKVPTSAPTTSPTTFPTSAPTTSPTASPTTSPIHFVTYQTTIATNVQLTLTGLHSLTAIDDWTVSKMPGREI